MTKAEIKRAAKEAMSENGYRVPMTQMVILESGSHKESFLDDIIEIIDYVMFKDQGTGREWQCYWGSRFYNPERQTLWAVEEYR